MKQIATNSGERFLIAWLLGSYWAQVLSQRLGRPVQVNEPYASVFPDGIIPPSAFSAPTKGTIGFIPAPNVGDNIYASAAVSTIRAISSDSRSDGVPPPK